MHHGALTSTDSPQHTFGLRILLPGRGDHELFGLSTMHHTHSKMAKTRKRLVIDRNSRLGISSYSKNKNQKNVKTRLWRWTRISILYLHLSMTRMQYYGHVDHRWFYHYFIIYGDDVFHWHHWILSSSYYLTLLGKPLLFHQ